MNRAVLLLDSPILVLFGAAHGLLDLADTFDDDLIFGGIHGGNSSLLSFVVTGDDDDFVTRFYVSFDFHVSKRLRLVELEHLGSEGHDLHEVLFAKLTGNGSENTGSLWIPVLVDDDDCIRIEIEEQNRQARRTG